MGRSRLLWEELQNVFTLPALKKLVFKLLTFSQNNVNYAYFKLQDT